MTPRSLLAGPPDARLRRAGRRPDGRARRAGGEPQLRVLPLAALASATGQRGWNRQPEGTSTGFGVSPGEDLRAWSARGGRAWGPPKAAPWCRGAAGCPPPRAAGPCSTIRPRYITAIRSAKCAAVDRSWVIMRMPMSPSRRSPSSRDSTPGPDRDVEHRHRLVGEQQPGAEHQRGGDRDPLPLAAGQLVRVAVQVQLAPGPARPAPARATAVASRSARDPPMPCTSIGSSTVPGPGTAGRATRTGPGRSSAACAAAGAAAAAISPAMSVPVSRTAPLVGLTMPQDRLRRGRLAAAGLADQGHHLAAGQAEADPVHGVHPLLGGAGQPLGHAAPHLVVGGQVGDLQQRGLRPVIPAALAVAGWRRSSALDAPTVVAVAGGPVADRHQAQPGSLAAAAVERSRSAAGTGSRRFAVQPRRRAGDGDHRVPPVEVGGGGEEQPGVRVAGRVEERLASGRPPRSRPRTSPRPARRPARRPAGRG